jgi:micrococcal nuclease
MDPAAIPVVVVSIADGDTLDVRLTDGSVDTVRLIGINTPERGECWAIESALALEKLAPLGSRVGITADTSDRDQFGRLLRYVWVGGLSVNEEMARRGAAISRRYPPDTAMASRLEEAQVDAQRLVLGLWAADACGPPADAELRIVQLDHDPPGDDTLDLNAELIVVGNAGDNLVDLSGWGIKDESSSHRYSFPAGFSLAPGETVTVHSGCGEDFGTSLFWCAVGSAIWNNDGDTAFVTDPSGNIHTSLGYGPPPPAASPAPPPPPVPFAGGGGTCDSSYQDVCIPPPPPDLDCGDIPHRDIRVVGSDPHGFDGNHDGVGCES